MPIMKCVDYNLFDGIGEMMIKEITALAPILHEDQGDSTTTAQVLRLDWRLDLAILVHLPARVALNAPATRPLRGLKN